MPGQPLPQAGTANIGPDFRVSRRIGAKRGIQQGLNDAGQKPQAD